MNSQELKNFRESKNLTQTDLAKFFGVSADLVSSYETGKIPIPKHIERVIYSFISSSVSAAANQYLKTYPYEPKTELAKEAIKRAFIAGAKWKQQVNEVK